MEKTEEIKQKPDFTYTYSLKKYLSEIYVFLIDSDQKIDYSEFTSYIDAIQRAEKEFDIELMMNYQNYNRKKLTNSLSDFISIVKLLSKKLEKVLFQGSDTITKKCTIRDLILLHKKYSFWDLIL